MADLTLSEYQGLSEAMRRQRLQEEARLLAGINRTIPPKTGKGTSRRRRMLRLWERLGWSLSGVRLF
jgi:hypothetical protein